MLINVLNGSLKKVAILSNELPNAPSYYNDEFHDYLEQGATTFSFTVAKVINNQLQDYTQFLSDQSYFSFRKNGRDYLMTPSSEQSVHETSTEISFFCVSLDRELINEQANSLANTASHNIQWYFDRMGLISRTKITIGINEVSNLTRVINYDAQESKLSRLISVINNFNAEFDFVTTLNNDGSLGTVVLNIYKENDGQNIQGVGTKRDDVRLTFGKNIEDVEVDVSDDGFFNAAYMTGADGFSWKNYDFSYKNSDGVEEFYKRKGSEIAYAPLSAKMFPSQLKTDKGDIWTNSDRTTEYKNANDMWGYIVSQFKQYAYKQITYTVTPSSTLVNQLIGDGRPLQKGDTVIIQDDNYMDIDGNVGLILSARVSEIITSDTNPANNKIVFSNYKKLKSEASSDIKAIVSQLVNDATPYFADIATSNGVQFKNGTGSTTLSAHIYKGSATTETIADSYEWSKDGTVVANVQEITVDASGVANKAVYSFKATVAGKVVANQSVTITNVDDGTNGRSVTNVSQKWRLTTTTATPTQAWSDAGWLTTQPTTTATNKYLWSITRTTFNLAPLTQDVIEQKAVYGDKGDKGDTGNDGRAGKDGVGLRSTTVTYTISSSGTVTPTAGWNSQVPTLVKGQYLWTKTVWNYSDGTSESGYTVSYIAKDGNNGNDGIAGKDGVGIKTTTITYAGSTSGTTAPTSGWTSTVPTVAEGSYLWTKTVWDYTDKTSETGYSVAKMGEKGPKGDQGIQGLQGPDGTQGIPGPKGVDGTDAPMITVKSYTYSAGSRAEIELTGPNAFKQTVYNRGHNVWVIDATTHELKEFVSCETYTSMSFSHNGVSTTLADYLTSLKDSIVVIAAADADSIDQNVRDVLNSMGGFPDLGTWGSWRMGHVFIGMSKRNDGTWPLQPRQGYEEVVKEDGSALEIGCTLSKGGIVANGADGKTQYTHIAYANSADGSTDFSTSDSNRTYIGMYVDFKSDDSTNPSDYSWTLVKGADGTQGIPGKPGKDGTTPYFHTAWSYSADGTNGFTTVYPNLNLLTDSKYFKNKNVAISELTTTISSPYSTIVKENNDTYLHFSKTESNYSDWFRTYIILGSSVSPNFPNVDVKPNSQYTFSVWLKGTGTHTIYAYNKWTIPNPTTLTVTLTDNWTRYSLTVVTSETIPTKDAQFFIRSNIVGSEINLKYPKVEPGSIATPYMPSESEVTTADWPSYIGQRTDDVKADSTNPSAYTWSLIRGNDGKDGKDGHDGIAGKDGKGIKATVITYQASTNGTTAPTGTWSASVPTVAKGSFLWTRTIWTYTDNTTETGYAVAYMGTNGNNGHDGIAGKDGTGIKTTTITYAGSTSGTTAPTSGWTSTVPTVAAGSYLWTKTVWAYTDNTSETGYSVAMMGVKGDKGERGIQGPAGSNGDPGKIVSDTEPTTRFKGLTWKYLGMSDLTASDGTVILSGTEYYWSGTNWILNEINAHNINGDNLSVTNGTFTDGKIKSTWNSGTASGSTEIENSHINMSATNSSSKVTNSLGLDIQQGFGMRWTDPASNQSRSVSLDYGNLAFDRNGVAAGLNFDGANLSSSMPIQAPNTIVKSTQFSVSGIGIRLDRMMSFVAVTFSGQASSTINNSPTIINVLPDGFRPISPYSIDYMVPGNTANNGYIYFNPDGSIRIMATINSGYYIRGTRFYITNDVYPS